MKRPLVALLLVSLSALAARAAEVDVTWDGADGDWNDPAHWNLSQYYPDNGQPPGTTYGVTLNGGRAGGGGAFTVDRLTMPGGTLATDLTVALSASFNAPYDGTQAIIASSFRNSSTSTATLGEAFYSTLHIAAGATFTNDGTFRALGGILLGGGNVTADPAATFINNGTFLIDVPEQFDLDLRASGLTEHSTFLFQNNGTVKVLAGNFKLHVPDTGASTGSFDVAQNATLTLGGPLTLTGGGTLTGAGLVTVGGGYGFAATSNLITLNNANFTGTLQGSFAFNGVNTVSHFSGGSLLGDGTLTLTGESTLSNATIAIHELHVAGHLSLSTAAGAVSLDAAHVFVGGGATLSLAGPLDFRNSPTLTNNGLITVSTSASLRGVDTAHPEGTFTNNGTIDAASGFQTSASITFNNSGTIVFHRGGALSSMGTDSATAVLDVRSIFPFTLSPQRPLLAGTLLVSGALRSNPGANTTTTLGSALTFRLTGSTTVQSGTLLLAAPQDTATTGVFTVESAATLDLAADYSFATAGDPTLSGDGTVIVDPGITLTLAQDTAFSGTIQVNGTLIIAAPRDPNAEPGSLMQFTILPRAVPEPASLGFVSIGLVSLLARRRASTSRRPR